MTANHLINLHNKFKNTNGKIANIIRKFVELRNLGQTDDQIMQVLTEMKLPIGAHLFITGNYSDLMDYYSQA